MNITVYTRPTCAPCQTVKKWLTMKGYKYKEVNVDTELTPQDRETLGHFTMVPITTINGITVTGLNLSRMAELLQTT